MKHVLLIALAALLTLPPSRLDAQFDGGSSTLQSLTGGERGGQTPNPLLSREAMPVARTVDPSLYVCGPGDVMSLALTMPMNLEALLPVTADGALIIPRVGAVQVSGFTLEQARENVFAAMRKRFVAPVEGTLSLALSRPILVTVTGNVKNPGLLTLNAATPVSVALLMADTRERERATSTILMTQNEPNADPGFRARLGARYFGAIETEQRSPRRITIQHVDGSVTRADLLMYEATRDGRYNPTLREGDVIVVPSRDVYSPTIAVLGAVRRPGVFDFIEGDKLSDLLRMDFGADEGRTLLSAELTRDGMQSIPLPLQQLRSGVFTDDIALRPGDRLIVYTEQRRERNGSAAIDGEVLQPGVYPITPGKTTLRELVNMAGGFTLDAWPGLSELYRRQTGIDGLPLDLEREQMKNFEKSSLVYEDTTYWALSSKLRDGQVAVDFRRLFAKDDAAADIALEDGDILLVPRNTGTVYVYGQVNNTGFIPWSEGEDAKWYIAQAGGYGNSATKKRAAVIKANTRAWMNPDNTDIEPGDMIFVPHEPLVRLATTTDLITVASAVVGGLTGILSLIITLSR